MADLLFDNSANWTDGNGNTPPSTYVSPYYDLPIYGDTYTYSGSINSGDVINVTAAWSAITPSASTTVIVNADSGELGRITMSDASGIDTLNLTFDGSETGLTITIGAGGAGSNILLVNTEDFVAATAYPAQIDAWGPPESPTSGSYSPQTFYLGNVIDAGAPDSSLVIPAQPANGTASVDGWTITYSPNASFSGYDQVNYYALTSAGEGPIQSNTAALIFYVAGSVPPPPAPAPCDEFGRVTRAYVSGYQRNRIHRSELIRGEQRCLCAEFSGAISPARTIASVTWMCEQPYCIVMANPRIVGTECAVDINAQNANGCWMKCVATLDNGEVYTQLFYLTVAGAPYFVGEVFPTSSGPTLLTAAAVT